MNSKQKASPATVAALIAATCAAVGFAGWSITRAVSPPTPPPGTAPAGGNQTLAPAPLDLAGPAPEDSVQIKRVASGEAGLTPYADPFTPLPEPPPAAVALARVPTLPPLAPALPRGQRPPSLPSVAGWPGGLAGLPPAQPTPVLPGLPAPAVRALSQAPPAPPKPELIGTLMGERPSAVFRSGAQLTIVPVGGTVGGWQLVAVEHRGVAIRSGSTTSRLRVGGDRSEGSVITSEKPASRPAGPPALAPPGLAPQGPTTPKPRAVPPAAAPAAPPKSQPFARRDGPPPAAAGEVETEDGLVVVGGARPSQVALTAAAPILAQPAQEPVLAAGPEPSSDGAMGTVEQALDIILAPGVAVAAGVLSSAPAALTEPRTKPRVTPGTGALALESLPSPEVLIATGQTGSPVAPDGRRPMPFMAAGESRPGPTGPVQRAAAMRAVQPSSVPVPGALPPELAGRPAPPPQGVGAFGRALLTNDGPEAPAENAPQREADPPVVPARVVPGRDDRSDTGKPKPSATANT